MVKYRNLGTSLNRNQGNSRRSRSSVTDENVERIRELFENNPHVSAQRNGLGLFASSFSRITRKEMRWHFLLIENSFLKKV